MKKGSIDRKRTIVANHQTAEIPQPGERPLDHPAPFVASKNATILGRRPAPIQAERSDQLDAPLSQSASQRITVISFVGNHPQGFLPGTPRLMSSTHADRRERLLGESHFRRGGRVKGVSQRKTAAVDHHHPLRPLAPLGFSDFSAPFFAGAKLPSRNDSLHSSCSRWFSSARNARQMVSQTPCSSQSRSRRQQVVGEGNSSGKSHQRAPLRRIHKMPSNTLRSSFGGLPPCGRFGRFGSKGRIFSHWASVRVRPYRAIGPPQALLLNVIAHFRPTNYHSFSPLYRVLK